MADERLLLTPYIMELMHKREDFILFPKTNQILVAEECDNFNYTQGKTNLEPRFIFHHITDKYGRKGYVVNARNTTMSLMIPDDLIGGK